MMDYLITCLLISSVALIAVKGLHNAPARVSMFVLMGALLSWFVPWHLVPDFSVSSTKLQTTWLFNEVSLTDPIITVGEQASAEQTQSFTLAWYQALTWWHLFAGACVLGGVLFLNRVRQYVLLVNSLSKQAVDCANQIGSSVQYQVRAVDLYSPAITTGILKPTIWLDHSVLGRPELTSVLLHEETHAKQRDIAWIWFICFSESIFWWNPICILLGSKVRQQLELSCDERCFSQLKQQYQYDLASLILEPFKGAPKGSSYCAPVLNITHSKRFNVLRVKMLNKEKMMKNKHLVMLLAAISCSTLAAAQIVENNAVTASTVTASSSAALTASAKSTAYDAQMRELINFAANAKSGNQAELQQVATNLVTWQQNRTLLSGAEEVEIALLSFTLVSHVLHKLGQYHEVISAYETWYQEPNSAPYFVKNILSTTYLQLNQPELAVQQLESLKAQLGEDFQPGSQFELAQAYVQLANYNKALETLNNPKLAESVPAIVLKNYVYTQLNDLENAAKTKALLPENIAARTPFLIGFGTPSSPLLSKI